MDSIVNLILSFNESCHFIKLLLIFFCKSIEHFKHFICSVIVSYLYNLILVYKRSLTYCRNITFMLSVQHMQEF